jgi:multidrug efflux system outer membrane protein
MPVVLIGCRAVGPDYRPHQVAVPDSWTRVMKHERDATHTAAENWWEEFKDPCLSRLIATARQNNSDIRRAKARIQQSWQQRQMIRAALFPSADVFGKNRYGLGTFDEDGIQWGGGTSVNQVAQLDVGWELDLFGGIHRQSEAATAGYEASVEAWRDYHVVVTAEVALHYIALRSVQTRLRIARAGVSSFKEIDQLVHLQQDLGLAAKVDSLESSARLKVQEAKVPGIENEEVALVQQLSLLLGIYPNQIERMIRLNGGIPQPPRPWNPGVPADLLRSRPDIRQAERLLQLQCARIGIATANLYPSLSLAGSVAYEVDATGGASQLLRNDLGLGPALRLRLFHTSADRARVKEQEAALEADLATYEEVVLRAVTEVEQSMSAIQFDRKRLEKLSGASNDYRARADLMNESYRSGLADLHHLIVANQDALDATSEEAATRGRVAAHSVRLFKSLGGGVLKRPE